MSRPTDDEQLGEALLGTINVLRDVLDANVDHFTEDSIKWAKRDLDEAERKAQSVINRHKSKEGEQ